MILADAWKTAPFMALLLLAGLQVIPSEIYEAAKVDGATAWQWFRSITLPLLMPALLVALIFRTLDALRTFDLPKVLTNGANGTTTMSLIAQRTFQENRLYGEGAAISIITFVIVMMVAVRLHPAGRRQHPRHDGGSLAMEAATAWEGDHARGHQGQEGTEGPGAAVVDLLAVAGVVIFCLFPFYWLVNISLKTGPTCPTLDLCPPNPTLENYKSIFQNDDFTRALANSAIVALVTTFIGIVVGSFAPTRSRA